MRILVFSDSHSALRVMRQYMDAFRPQAVIHLGDFYEDGDVLREEYCHIPFHIVAGNCDAYRCPLSAREMLCYPIGGVMMYLTHGHRQRVKEGLGGLLADARRYGADIALYGHTHKAYCGQEDGMWVLNPGSCGFSGGTAGLVETDGEKITACRILSQADLEVKNDFDH